MQTCLLCESESLKSVELKAGETYWHCQNCSYLFLSPELRYDRPSEESRYREHNNDLQDERYLSYLKKTWDKVSDLVKPRALVVDYGCGPTKGLEEVLRSSDFQVISYDPLFYPNGLELFFGNVNVIFCSEAIEHMYDPCREIGIWMKLLKPGGLITLRTSFHPGLDSFSSWHYKDDPTHVGFYDEATFKVLAERYDLEILHMHSPYASFRKN